MTVVILGNTGNNNYEMLVINTHYHLNVNRAKTKNAILSL